MHYPVLLAFLPPLMMGAEFAQTASPAPIRSPNVDTVRGPRRSRGRSRSQETGGDGTPGESRHVTLKLNPRTLSQADDQGVRKVAFRGMQEPPR